MTRGAVLTLLVVLAAAVVAADEPILSRLADADAATKDLVARVVSGFGGESALGSVERLHEVASIVQREGNGEFRMSVAALSDFPGRNIARIRTKQGMMTIAINEEEAYLIPAKASVSGAAIRLTPEEREDLVHYFVSNPLFVIKNRRSSRYFFGAGPKEEIGGAQCQRLYVFADGLRLDWVVDLPTGHVVRTEIGEQRSEFSDWKAMGVLSVPYRVRTTERGKLISEQTYSVYEANPKQFDVARAFRKPDLWLTRWKVQPVAGSGRAYTPSSGMPATEQSKSGAPTTAATYRPPIVDATEANVIIWDSSMGTP